MYTQKLPNCTKQNSSVENLLVMRKLTYHQIFLFLIKADFIFTVYYIFLTDIQTVPTPLFNMLYNQKLPVVYFNYTCF